MKLEVKNLSFSYPKKETIKDINFVAHEGDIVAILGVNGVGKSTMLKCLNNVHKPKSGQVLFNDVNVLNLKKKEISKIFGYVSQEGHFIDGTVFENVLIGRKPFIKWGLNDDDFKEVDEAIQITGLDKLSDRHIDKLSGGERQLVGISRVLAQKTPILLLDEPTSNLDIKNQIQCLNVIKDIVKKNNFIALISIHDVNTALRFANKFLVLKDGKVYKYGDESIINEDLIKDVYGVKSKISYSRNDKYLIFK